MSGKPSKADKKIAYDAKLCQLLDEYSQILIVAADNVGSNQLQNIRTGLRGDSVVLMGKNTMMKRTIRVHSEKTGNNAFLNLIPLLQGNVGLIFTKGDLKEVSEEVAKYKVGAPARVGLVAPIDVACPTWQYWARPVPDLFLPEVLDLTEDDLVEKFATGVSMVTSLALAISYPTLAAAPHMFINAYKNVLAVAVATEYSFPQAEKVKEYLKDPSKFAVAVVPVAAADAGGAPAAATKEEEKKEEPAEESDDDMGFSLFD
ncbi:hypothetical protein GH714_012615 [Hevea brasiliensis]|uniref:60S acidic ribosomal protein P0 n=1 Tax=Hevea brasiliensis TaxID=3981 RepID=A0A6A6MYY8_HEVBR|nr:hypothetical protein GH714_012615 [Hevea brasiliensis]